MTDKEQIMIDGCNVSGCSYYNPLGNYNCGGTKKCSQWSNCYFKQLARKTQECEKLEDFRTLTREVFTFGDSDVDDENFIKYLQEYSRSYEEAIDGYYRLTDITGIDYTVHGGADIEEIIKRVDILKQECEELKKQLETSEKWRIKAESSNEKLELRNTCYRKALEEIERYCSIKNDPDIQDVPYRIIAPTILNIINKAKGKQ